MPPPIYCEGTKILHLTLKKKWFDMIASGEKKEEYREVKDYWVLRLLELKEPFSLPQFAITYNDIRPAYHFCKGYRGDRFSALEFLLNEMKCAAFKTFDIVRLTNGYGKDKPTMDVDFMGMRIGEAQPAWGGPGTAIIISLGKILSKSNF